MGFTWHSTNQSLEAGVDGWVELRDSLTGEVKNIWIPIQSKAVSELTVVDGLPTYYCRLKDLEYWLQGSSPVILIVSVPEDDLAYWISVKDYFRGKNVEDDKTIRFDPVADKINQHTAERWKLIGNQQGAGTYFTPARISERLMTNLIRVSRMGSTVYTAETSCKNRKEFKARLQEIAPFPPREWAYGNGKKIYSFHDLNQQPWSLVCDVNSIDTVETSRLANSDEPASRNAFIQLLDGCFNEITSSWKLQWNAEQECHYFKPHPTKVERDFRYRARKNKTKRDVVSKQMGKVDKDRIAYYRHNAFSHRFLRYDTDWFLMLEPTYVFTSDGVSPDHYREEHLSGIKRLEGDAAVSGAIIMYLEMLRDRDSLFDKPYPFLGFGDIEWIECDVGIDDKFWAVIKAADDEKMSKDVQTSFGEGVFD